MLKVKTSILLKLIFYAFHLPLYLISLLIPKNKNIWIFGGWFGEQYSDNTKYLFEYINRNHPEIKAVWLSRNKEVINLIRNKGFKAYYCYSIYGYLYSALAKICIVNIGIGDVNKFIPPPIIINLWHGIPLKKIGYDDVISNSKIGKYKDLKKFLFPFIRYREDVNLAIACSEEDQSHLSTALKIPKECVKITGYPRNDNILVSTNQKILKYNVSYLPTFRGGINDKVDLFSNFGFDIVKWNNELGKLSVFLNIKMHPVNKPQDRLLEEFKHCKNISFLDEIDVAELLPNTQILITDYSSVFFDYLLMDRPIIFAPFDYEEYITKDRELYYDYNEVTPGPKCRNWDEVLEWIEKFKNNPALYAEERRKLRNRFHKYQDGKSCERVYKEIDKLIKG
mgnify:FL=1